MMTVADETAQALMTLEQFIALEDVADRVASRVDAEILHRTSHQLLDALAPLRPRAVAQFLGISEKTVRRWTEAGLLHSASSTPTLRLDPVRVVQVRAVIDRLGEQRNNRDLLDHVWYRLQDEDLLSQPDLQESIEQFHSGELVTRR